MQGQRRAGIAVGQHQHRETPDRHLGIFAGRHMVGAQRGSALGIGRGIEGDGFHRLRIQRVEKTHAMKPHTPMGVRCRRGVH